MFCFKGRIDDERLEETRSNDAYFGGTGGDYVMIWIDSLEPLPKMGMKRCVSKSQAFAS
jgi:hypothetical protein